MAKNPSAAISSPPKTERQARDWAASHAQSDAHAISLLAPIPRQSASSAGACVLALTLLGGPLAMDVALRYRGKHTARWGQTFADPLARAFVRAWNTFPHPGFVALLVDGLDVLNLLNAPEESLQHLEGMESAHGLREFYAYLDDDVSLEPLRRCVQLERLTLGRPGGEHGLDLGCLREFLRLEFVGLGVRDQIQLANVATCRALRRMNLSLGPKVRLAPLVPDAVLRRLELPTEPHDDLLPLVMLAEKIQNGVEITIDAKHAREGEPYHLVLSPAARALLG